MRDPSKGSKTILKINDESSTRLMPFGRADCFRFAHSAEANWRLGGSEAWLHFCSREVPGRLWEAPGEGLVRLWLSLLEA